MSKDIFGFHHWVEARDALNILQCTGQPPATKIYPVENVNTVKIEKP